MVIIVNGLKKINTNVFIFSEVSLNTGRSKVQIRAQNCGWLTIRFLFFCMGTVSSLLSKCTSLRDIVCRIV